MQRVTILRVVRTSARWHGLLWNMAFAELIDLHEPPSTAARWNWMIRR